MSAEPANVLQAQATGGVLQAVPSLFRAVAGRGRRSRPPDKRLHNFLTRPPVVRLRHGTGYRAAYSSSPRFSSSSGDGNNAFQNEVV